MKIAIFASGNGSNAEALVKKALTYDVHPLILTDNPHAGIIERIRPYQLECHIVPFTKNHSKKVHEDEIQTILAGHEISWIFLAGYLRLLSKNFLKNYYNVSKKTSQVINIHPSLLPKYPGLQAYERIFAAGEKYSGATVHFVDEGMDTGKIILQESFPLQGDDTLESFRQRGLELEHRIYAQVLEWVIKEQIWDINKG